MENVDIERYADMLDLPYPRETERARMPMRKRAAQFAPFAALSGFGKRVDEVFAPHEVHPEQSEERKQEIGAQLELLRRMLPEPVELEVEYYAENGIDKLTFSASLVRIDLTGAVLYFDNGKEITVPDLIRLDGRCFRRYEE